jgi:uncharacterized membrane protein YkvA (DUF1232 family)
MRKIADLKRKLKELKLSPEAAAKTVKISNMTIRRMLAQPGTKAIPEKYWLPLQSLQSCRPVALNFSPQESLDEMLPALRQLGRSVDSLDTLRGDLRTKLKQHRRLGKEFHSALRKVMGHAFGKQGGAHRSLALGGLLYFINPLDLIPDIMFGVGFMDDFAVLTLVLAALAREIRR